MDYTPNAYFENRVGFVIHCATGCSCCEDQNYLTGFYDTVDEAINAALGRWDSKTLKSQYASNGRYKVARVEYTFIKIPDEKELYKEFYIFEGMVFNDSTFFNDMVSFWGGVNVGTTDDDERGFHYTPTWIKWLEKNNAQTV